VFCHLNTVIMIMLVDIHSVLVVQLKKKRLSVLINNIVEYNISKILNSIL